MFCIVDNTRHKDYISPEQATRGEARFAFFLLRLIKGWKYRRRVNIDVKKCFWCNWAFKRLLCDKSIFKTWNHFARFFWGGEGYSQIWVVTIYTFFVELLLTKYYLIILALAKVAISDERAMLTLYFWSRYTWDLGDFQHLELWAIYYMKPQTDQLL